MKQIFAVIIAFCFALFLLAVPASADEWPQPDPFYIISEDGSRVFHVTPDNEWAQAAIEGWADFPPTGLYYNTDPLTPIYLMENPSWALWKEDFILSRDMQYFVWIPQTNAQGIRHDYCPGGATALVFYAGGAVQRTYMVSDLVGDLGAVWWSVTAVDWIRFVNRAGVMLHRDFDVDAQNDQLIVRTMDHQEFIFDITTGEIVASGYVEPTPNPFDVLREPRPAEPEVLVEPGSAEPEVLVEPGYTEPALDEPVYTQPPADIDFIASAAVALAAAIGSLALLIM